MYNVLGFLFISVKIVVKKYYQMLFDNDLIEL